MFEHLASQVTDWLLVAPVITCFAGSFIGGTVVILVFATFAGSADIPWWLILCGACLGNYTADIGWFALARSPLSDRIRNSRHFAERDEQIIRLRTNFRKRDLLFFVAIKFAYGLRIAQILLLGAAHYAWRRFLAFDGVAVLIINTAAVLAGWTFGRGVTRYLDWFENTGTVVTSIVLVLAAFIALRWLINRYMLRRR
jgi:membrane protein DedA with SNARE-associated domain